MSKRVSNVIFASSYRYILLLSLFLNLSRKRSREEALDDDEKQWKQMSTIIIIIIHQV